MPEKLRVGFATEMGLPLFTTLIAQQVLRVAAHLGLGEEGTQVYVKALEAMAGVRARRSGA